MMTSHHDRIWTNKSDQMVRVLKEFHDRRANMELLGVDVWGNELRALVKFKTETFVRPPGGEVELVGPVVCGIFYHREYLSRAPVPWEIVTVLEPLHVFHPSVNPGGGMCLGHPMPGLSMDQILHTSWAGLVYHSRVVNTVDYQVFNPAAAAYVRSIKERLPLTTLGLLEKEPQYVG